MKKTELLGELGNLDLQIKRLEESRKNNLAINNYKNIN